MENFEKVQKSKFSKKNSENKFSDSFNSSGVEDFAQIFSGIEIPDTFKIRDFEIFGNRTYAKFSIEKLINNNYIV